MMIAYAIVIAITVVVFGILMEVVLSNNHE